MNFKEAFHFLSDLRQNNNREWFAENNKRYQKVKREFTQFIDDLIPVIKQFESDIDVTAKDCVFRIFRDVRFSKNKAPYKTNLGAFIAKGGRKSPYAGYYLHIEPGGSFLGGGIYMPESAVLKAIRTGIFENTEEFRSIIHDPAFREYFDGIYGETLVNPPRGFPKDFPDVDLLKHKHYAVTHPVNDSFWNSKHIFDDLARIYRIQYPFNRFLNRAVERVV